jgi:hypothetical protein
MASLHDIGLGAGEVVCGQAYCVVLSRRQSSPSSGPNCNGVLELRCRPNRMFISPVESLFSCGAPNSLHQEDAHMRHILIEYAGS